MKTKFLLVSLMALMAIATPCTASNSQPIMQQNVDSLCHVAATPDVTRAQVRVNVNLPYPIEADSFMAEASFEGQLVASATSTIGQPLELHMPEDFLRWTPDHPFLYDLKVSVLSNNKVILATENPLAMRSFGTWCDESGTERFTLNELPIFLFGTRWTNPTDTLPSDDEIASDIQKIKDLGFNMVRIEGDADLACWRLHCDSVGLILWHDAWAEVCIPLQAVPTIVLDIPFATESVEQATDAYMEYANGLYQMAFKNISAAVFGRLADTETHRNGLTKLDEKRLRQINRKISHALAE